VEFNPIVGNLLDLRRMANLFASSGAEWLVGGIDRALKNSDNDPKNANTSQLIAIHRLIDLDVAFELADAKEVELWMIVRSSVNAECIRC
jgi:hypothetical protein